MNPISIIQVIDIDIFSFFILLVLLVAISNKLEQNMVQHRLFRILILINMLLAVVEILGWVFDASAGATSAAAYWVNLLANTLLYCLVPLPAAIWFLYAHFQIFHDLSRLRRMIFILTPPMVINTFMSMMSTQTGWFFSVDAANYYSRGPFFLLHVGIAYGYLAAACLMVVINGRLLERRNYKTLLLFVVPQVLGGLLQVLIYGLSVNWAAMMVSILIVYLNIQDRGLNTDFLTGTYNRRHFEQIISNMIRRVGDTRHFAVVLCDMDHFKSINDRFGHKAGDEALQHTVHLLRDVLRKEDLIARFGGDEFYLLMELNDDIALQAAVRRIYQAFDKYNQGSGLPYLLELSMGGAIYELKSGWSADQFLRVVDQLMYQEKARRREYTHNGLRQEMDNAG